MIETTEVNSKLDGLSSDEINQDNLSDKIKEAFDKIKETDIPTVDSKIFGFLENLAKEKGTTFTHMDSALEHLRLFFGDEVATVKKIYVGGTAGHSDGTLVYRTKQSEIEKFPWWKAAFENLGLEDSIEITKD